MPRIADIITTTSQFRAAAEKIDSFDKLVIVLAHIANSEDLKKQLKNHAAAIEVREQALDREFVDTWLKTSDAFGTYYDCVEFEEILDGIADFIIGTSVVTYGYNPEIDHMSIMRLANLGIDVAINYSSGWENIDDEDMEINIYPTFKFPDFTMEL